MLPDDICASTCQLQETNEMVATLQQELQELQPVLQEKTAQTEALLLQVAQDTEEADRVSVVLFV